VQAGCRLLRRSSIRDWRALTVRGVAEEAGVNERTVYRWFGDEQGLRDAVMHRLEEDSGIDLEGLTLAEVASGAQRILGHVAQYPMRSRAPLDPTLAEAGRRQREALYAAVAARADGWADAERRAVAALLDVLWSVGTYERLVADWEFDPDQAIAAVTWAIGLVERAVVAGSAPPAAARRGHVP
jgi:AcrR family transcriptional regulator